MLDGSTHVRDLGSQVMESEVRWGSPGAGGEGMGRSCFRGEGVSVREDGEVPEADGCVSGTMQICPMPLSFTLRSGERGFTWPASCHSENNKARSQLHQRARTVFIYYHFKKL